VEGKHCNHGFFFVDIFIDSLINTCGWWDLSNLPLAFLNWQFMGDTI
jgi:hypothetical protein